MIGWLLAITPICESQLVRSAGLALRELNRVGVINTNALAEFQRSRPMDFPNDNMMLVGKWMTKGQALTALAVLPAGIVIMVNVIGLVLICFRKKNSVPN